jgi:hypothetical protein
MAHFLARHPLTRPRQELADLARLEWARLEVFAAPHVPVLGERDGVERLAGAELRLTPACRLVFVWHSIDALWSAVDRDQPMPSAERRPETMLVWRREYQVLHRVLSHDEAAGLRLVQSGAHLDEVCGVLAQSGEDISAAAEKVFGVMRQWIADQVLCVSSGNKETR